MTDLLKWNAFQKFDLIGFDRLFARLLSNLDIIKLDLEHKVAISALERAVLEPVGRISGEPDQVYQACADSWNLDSDAITWSPFLQDTMQAISLKADVANLVSLRQKVRDEGFAGVAHLIQQLYDDLIDHEF